MRRTRRAVFDPMLSVVAFVTPPAAVRAPIARFGVRTSISPSIARSQSFCGGGRLSQYQGVERRRGARWRPGRERLFRQLGFDAAYALRNRSWSKGSAMVIAAVRRFCEDSVLHSRRRVRFARSLEVKLERAAQRPHKDISCQPAPRHVRVDDAPFFA